MTTENKPLPTRTYPIRENGDCLTGTNGRWYYYHAATKQHYGPYPTQREAMDLCRSLESRRP